MHSIFTSEPKLCHHNYDLSKAWFVYFYSKNLQTKEVIREQFRGQINKYSTKQERLREANEIIKYCKAKIKNDYNPFDRNAAAKTEQALTFVEALDFGLSKCIVATKTYAGYKSTVKFIKLAAMDCKFHKMNIQSVKRIHIKTLLERGKQMFNWSNKTYNKQLGYLKAVIGRVEEWEVIDSNPVHKIHSLPTVCTRVRS